MNKGIDSIPEVKLTEEERIAHETKQLSAISTNLQTAIDVLSQTSYTPQQFRPIAASLQWLQLFQRDINKQIQVLNPPIQTPTPTEAKVRKVTKKATKKKATRKKKVKTNV